MSAHKAAVAYCPACVFLSRRWAQPACGTCLVIITYLCTRAQAFMHQQQQQHPMSHNGAPVAFSVKYSRVHEKYNAIWINYCGGGTNDDTCMTRNANDHEWKFTRRRPCTDGDGWWGAAARFFNITSRQNEYIRNQRTLMRRCKVFTADHLTLKFDATEENPKMILAWVAFVMQPIVSQQRFWFQLAK